MYSEYYGFRDRPFTLTPNPRFFFMGEGQREALAHLLYGIEQHAGFISLTAEVGMGKTTLLRSLLEGLDRETHRFALIFNPRLSAVELLRSINREYGIPHHQELGMGELLDRLYQFLLDENGAGRTVTLVIDEAQNLHPHLLEQIRLISNLETCDDKLIQIVLAGQPELAALLERHELRQLSQRIAVRCELPPLSRDEVAAYVDHRIIVSAGYRTVVFTPGAIDAVYRFSAGVPRLVNVVCDRALLVAFTRETREVSRAHVGIAVDEIRGNVPFFRRVRKRALSWFLAGS